MRPATGDSGRSRSCRIDLDGLARDRDQLWAEAMHFYHAGERWRLEDDGLIATATAEQAARREDDPWEEPITGYIETTPQGDDSRNPWGCLSSTEQPACKPKATRCGWLAS